MRRLLVIAVALLLGCGAGHAQSVIGAPAMGATSPLGTLGSTPLGTPGSTTPGSPTGIPFGATELDPGGLSPVPIERSGQHRQLHCDRLLEFGDDCVRSSGIRNNGYDLNSGHDLHLRRRRIKRDAGQLRRDVVGFTFVHRNGVAVFEPHGEHRIDPQWRHDSPRFHGSRQCGRQPDDRRHGAQQSDDAVCRLGGERRLGGDLHHDGLGRGLAEHGLDERGLVERRHDRGVVVRLLKQNGRRGSPDAKADQSRPRPGAGVNPRVANAKANLDRYAPPAAKSYATS